MFTAVLPMAYIKLLIMNALVNHIVLSMSREEETYISFWLLCIPQVKIKWHQYLNLETYYVSTFMEKATNRGLILYFMLGISLRMANKVC